MATHIIPFYVLCLSIISISHIMIFTSAQSDTYIVHMDRSAMPKAFSDYHSWYSATIETLSENSNPSINSSPKLIYSYTHAIQGFSAHLSVSELEALKNSPGYISSIKDSPVEAATTHSTQFLGLNSHTGVWPASNYGSGVIIGVVDTGVWPESKSFNDNGISKIPKRWKGKCENGTQFSASMCNRKLIGARSFNKAADANNPGTIVMNSTRDIDGHGTHTASTAAGNYVSGASYFGYAAGVARGAAPKAHVAMYKVFWEGGSSESDVIAAIDQAIMDGVDVLSLSLNVGSRFVLYEDVIAIATFAAMEKGIFISTSAGNRGNRSPFIGTISNGTPWVLTVGAGTIDREFSGVVVLGNGVTAVGSSLYPGNSSLSNLQIVFMDACNNSKQLKKVRKNIVVCFDEDLLSLSNQVDFVQNAKVAGGIFISNNTAEFRSLSRSSFPATFLDSKKGEIIIDYIKNSKKKGPPKASIEFKKTFLGKKLAPTVASYSSKGPSQTCPWVLKPDILAPGTLILAAYPPIQQVAEVNSNPLFSNFDILSGTSMATPHAAGVAALLKAAHPEWGPAAIRSAMMTTTYSTDNTNNPIKDEENEFVTPISMGAGHIDPNKALDPGLIYNTSFQDYVNLICALNFTTAQIKTITRTSSYDCSNPSLDLNYPSIIAFFNAPEDSNSDLKIVQEFRRTVTNVGEGMSTYTVNVTPINEVKVSVHPKKLMFKKKYEQLSFKVSVKGPRRLKETVNFGYLSWVESKGKHVVRSPIVATSLSYEIST